MTSTPQDVLQHNRRAWDVQVARKNPWTLPVDSAAIERARHGDWSIVLTPTKSVPRDWFPPLRGLATLCLASGGGQQGPILAAAGANVVVFDNSPRQLDQDRMVANRDQLVLDTVQGDMTNLSVFPDERFDLIVHPCSNGFVPDVRPVWKEAHRVLRTGGTLLSGFVNPLLYLFDYPALEQGEFSLVHRIPFSDVNDSTDEEKAALVEADEPFSFGHTLEDLIGGQTEAGFAIIGFYEDVLPGFRLSHYISSCAATRAKKS